MLTINKAAKLQAMPVSTIRYYEKIGLLKINKKANGYRVLTAEDIEILKYIKVLKYTQFSLSELKTVTKLLSEKPSRSCGEASLELLLKKQNDIKQNIKVLQDILILFETVTPYIEKLEYEIYEPIISKTIFELFDEIQKEG